MSKARFSLSGQTEKSATFTLEEIDAEDLKKAVLATLKVGAAITLSLSRDKSTVCLSIIDNGKVEKAYAANVAELEVLLETIQLQAELL